MNENQFGLVRFGASCLSLALAASIAGCAGDAGQATDTSEAAMVEGNVEKAAPVGEASEAAIDDAEAAQTDDFWTDAQIAAATPLDGAKSDASQTSAAASGTPFDGVPAVGALFSSDGTGSHYCSASVVTSNNHSLVLTAAHCIHGGARGGYRSHLAFVPQFHAGARPFGTWIVRAALVDSRWAKSSDPDLDFGFAAVSALHGRKIQDVVGSNRLAINRGFHNVVQVIGYPSSANRPITCRNTTSQQSRYQMRFDCGGYSGGTSGSPWLMNFNGHTGDVIGVIGGYQQGGATASISYSAYFDHDIDTLHTRADH